MNIVEYTLSIREHDLLMAAYDSNVLSPQSIAHEHLIDLGERCPGLRHALLRFRDPVENCGLVVIHGLPKKNVDNIPSPQDRRNPAGVDQRTEACLRLCAGLIGATIRAPAGEKFPFNTPFHHVIPQREHVHTPAVNHGAGNFPFHQDRIFLEHTPHFHLLAGVRVGNDPCTTAFLDARPLLAELNDELIEALRANEFEDPHTGVRVPILRSSPNGEYLGMDLQPGWMEPTTERAKRALEYLRERSMRAGPNEIASVLIGPGDMVIHDHRRVLHGRESFAPDFSKPYEIRWMIRSHASA